jgi:hypothetical protein
VIFTEAFVDESGTHEGSAMLTVAGYMFRQDQARLFSRDWKKVLDHYGLPAAHMTDAVHCAGDYKRAGLVMADCDLCNRRLIENIKRRTIFGFGVSVDPEMYERIVGRENNAPSPYTFALQGCFTIIRRWAKRTSFDGSISYIFEAGHNSASEASRYIDMLLASPESKEVHRYARHSFLDKRLARELQAADMLAWQYQHFHARKAVGIDRPRKDYAALIRDKDVCIDHTEESLRRFRTDIIDQGWLVDRY